MTTHDEAVAELGAALNDAAQAVILDQIMAQLDQTHETMRELDRRVDLILAERETMRGVIRKYVAAYDTTNVVLTHDERAVLEDLR